MSLPRLLRAVTACVGLTLASAHAQTFASPQAVTLEGYDGAAMEPFLSRDGQTLFFNNRNDPSKQTGLYWATRIDARTFRFRGLVEGVRSNDLDGVPTMSRAGRFCFVSPRTYRQTVRRQMKWDISTI
jgi:hypothetical protein